MNLDLHQEWTTFQGRKVTFATIDHQHLSNIFYFWKYVLSSREEDLQMVQDVADERFNGQLLPYRPHRRFKYEINALKEKGYLRVKENKISIVINEIEIGEIFTRENLPPAFPI